jgi:hypothetical protein
MDLRALREMRDAINSILNAQIVTGPNAQIHYSDANMIIQVPTAPPAGLYPFATYKINNTTATDEQKLVYTEAGVTINDYTYQIRSGLVGYRPFLSIPTNLFDGTFDATYKDAWGNFESQVFCPNTDDTDYTQESLFDPPVSATFGASVALSNTSDVVINDAGDTIAFEQILIDPAQDANGCSLASFWLEMIDSPNPDTGVGLYARLYGRMWSYAGAAGTTGRPEFPFPQGPDIIPISAVGKVLPGDWNVNQPASDFSLPFLTGNLVNRYTRNGATLRGAWTADALSGQTFYNFDIVVDDSLIVDLTDGLTAYGVYQYIGNIGVQTEAPNTDPTNWKYIWTQIIL